MANPFLQTAPLVFTAMVVAFTVVMLGCSISDAMRR